MRHTFYNSAKAALKETAKQAKQTMPGDKPGIRFEINCHADSLIHEFNRQFEGKRAALYEKWLSAYACTLHPKD
jgi:hypothetical protein